MIAAIEDPAEADVILQSIPWSLTNNRDVRRWPLFSRAQKQAVAAYLQFQIEHFANDADDERKALRILEENL